jgi:cytochrome c oxidase assembly protein subunit 15
MAIHEEQLRKVRRTALLLAALSLLIVLVSAYLRLDGAGLGCADWPACYGKLLTSESQAPQFGIVRLLHRVTATLALLLACYLVWRCLRPQPIQPAARYASLLLLLMLALSALGIWSSDQRLSLVGFLNIMGGFGLVTFSWRVMLASRPLSMAATAPPKSVLLLLGVTSLSATVILGASIGASYAAVSCASVPHCNGVWWPSVEGWAALNPFVKLAGAARPDDPGGVTLHLLHRYSAAIALLLLGTAGVRALAHDATRSAAKVVLFLLLVELGLGALTVLSGFGLWLAVSHGVCAAALLAAVATLLRR